MSIKPDRSIHAVDASGSNTDLLSLIDSIPAMVAYIDCNMILQYCNHPFRTRFGLDDDVSGKSFPVVIGKQMFEQLQRNMGKVLVGDRAHFELCVPTLTDQLWFDATLSPHFDYLRKVKGFIFHCSDITEKNKTEWMLRDYFENASIGLHWVNADGMIIWANPAELKMLGYAKDEYIGHHISKFHANKNVSQDLLQRLSDKQTLKNYEVDLLCKDGSIRHVSINSSVLWEGDRFVHTRCFTVDVSQQKIAAEALKESEERFRMMATLVPLILWTTDEEGECNFLSIRWEEATGSATTDGLGKGWINFIHPEDRENIKRSWMTSFDDRKTFEAKFRLLNASGGYNAFYANSRPRYSASGVFAGNVGLLQDISIEEKIKSSLEKIVLERTDDLRKRNEALKLAEKELVEKNLELETINKQLSSFAHIASHDLQEPLRKIQTFSKRLIETEGDKLSVQGQDLFHRINASSNKMRTLIEDILTYAKGTTNEGSTETVDLNVLVMEVVNELDLKIAEKKAKVENFGLPRVKVVKFQFHQLFLNLIGNGLKFSKQYVRPHIIIKSEMIDGGQVSAKVGLQEERYYHITVSDNGIGFEPKFSETIFEKFQRLHTPANFEGSGIGLAICKKIIEDHQGLIIAEGEVGVGATFHLYLPAR